VRLVLTLVTCDGHENDYAPYGITGFDVYVYNNVTEKEFYAGRGETRYGTAKDDLSKTQSLAYSIARRNHLEDWSYITCTVTSSITCATKVR